MDQYLIIGDETHDAVKELCRQAWDAGQRDMLAKCIAALLSVQVRHWPYDETSDTYAECITVDSAVDALRALLEGDER